MYVDMLELLLKYRVFNSRLLCANVLGEMTVTESTFTLLLLLRQDEYPIECLRV